MKKGLLAATMLSAMAFAGQAHASLSLFNSVTGNVGVTTDGCGTNAATCTLMSDVPAGSTITGAYLYSSTYSGSTNPNGVTLQTGAGAPLAPTFTALGVADGFLQAWRANVTSYVQANMALGGASLTVNEGALTAALDGEGLVVTFTNPTISTNTVFILDGFSQSGGDTSHIAFNPLPAGFTARMAIGDGFSYDGPDPANPTNSAQVSTIKANGTTLTNVAGHCDDNQTSPCANGSLITVGAINAGSDSDPYTPFPNPAIGQDHELYNLANVLGDGDTSLTLNTDNPSNNDNIFLEVIQVTGTAHIVPTPEPGTLALFGVGLLGLGLAYRRRSS